MLGKLFEGLFGKLLERLLERLFGKLLGKLLGLEQLKSVMCVCAEETLAASIIRLDSIFDPSEYRSCNNSKLLRIE